MRVDVMMITIGTFVDKIFSVMIMIMAIVVAISSLKNTKSGQTELSVKQNDGEKKEYSFNISTILVSSPKKTS
jgi:hypothetical protein